MILDQWIEESKTSGLYSPIKHLASAAFPFSDKHKYMLMLSAYMDETGHSSDEKQKFVGIAGLIAPAANWEAFEKKWKAALKLPYIDLPFFHMTDFAARKKHYEGWSEVKRQTVLGKLFKVIETIHPLPFGALIPMDLYRDLSEEYKEFLMDPYYLCFSSALAGCTAFLEFKKLPPDEKVALIFSEQVEFRNKALKIYEQVKEQEMLKARGTPPIFRDMRDIVPLQAADIVAYEMYKEYERRLHRPKAAPRFGYQRLVKMSERNNFGIPNFMFFDEERFAFHIKGYEETKKLFEQLEKEGKLEKPLE